MADFRDGPHISGAGNAHFDDAYDETDVYINKKPFIRGRAWIRDANCLGMDPSLSFSEQQGFVLDAVQQACAQCAVRMVCATYALAGNEAGTWGIPSNERRKLKAGVPQCRWQDRFSEDFGKWRQGDSTTTPAMTEREFLQELHAFRNNNTYEKVQDQPTSELIVDTDETK
jgi:hypothetical protein